MRVLSWVQSRLRGAQQHSTKKPELSAGSYRPAAADTNRSDDELHRHRRPAAAMLSIGTFGVVQGHRGAELMKMQEELALLMGAKRVTTPAGDKDDTLKRSLSGGRRVKRRSFRKFMSPTPSFSFSFRLRGTMPEMPWPLPHHNDTPSDNLAMSEATIKSYRTAQLPWGGNAPTGEQGNKWITTDSEYIVLEI